MRGGGFLLFGWGEGIFSGWGGGWGGAWDVGASRRWSRG